MDDLVSREAVKKWLERWDGYIDMDIVRRMQYRVIDIPSTQPDESTCWGCNCPKMDSLEQPTQTNADSMQWSALDCVSRQQAIDALCNDYCGGHQDCKYYPNCENLKSIEQLPSAQPEIIRCKDCRHLVLTGGNESTGEGIYNCNVWKRRTFKGDGFCSYAERRKE